MQMPGVHVLRLSTACWLEAHCDLPRPVVCNVR